MLHNKMDQEAHEDLSSFLRNLIWGNLIFLGNFLIVDWVWLKLSQIPGTIIETVTTWFLS